MPNFININEETIAIARSTNAVDYLRRKGVELKPEGRVYFPAEHDSLKIKDNYFHWFSRGLHGNTIDLAMAYFGYDFRTAVSDILSVGATTVPVTTAPDKLKNTPVELPVKAENEHRVIAYLCQRRKIAYKIVKQLIQDGRLYQDKHGATEH